MNEIIRVPAELWYLYKKLVINCLPIHLMMPELLVMALGQCCNTVSCEKILPEKRLEYKKIKVFYIFVHHVNIILL